MYLVYWLATLHIARRLKLDDYCGPFQPRPFSDSLILCNSYAVSMFSYLITELVSSGFQLSLIRLDEEWLVKVTLQFHSSSA